MKIQIIKQTGIWIDTAMTIVITLLNGEEIITEIESDIKTVFIINRKATKGPSVVTVT